MSKHWKLTRSTAGAESGSLSITRLSSSSWFRIDIKGQILYIDPGYGGSFDPESIPREASADKADIVLITHNHGDHLKPDELERLLDEDTIIIAPEVCADDIGRPFSALQVADSIHVAELKITAVHAYNTEEGRSTRKPHRKGEFNGYLIQADGITIYFAGDTDMIDEMKDFGTVDLAFLPIGGTYVMDAGEAVEAAQLIKPQILIPMHEATTSLRTFADEVKQHIDTTVITLEIGAQATIDYQSVNG